MAYTQDGTLTVTIRFRAWPGDLPRSFITNTVKRCLLGWGDNTKGTIYPGGNTGSVAIYLSGVRFPENDIDAYADVSFGNYENNRSHFEEISAEIHKEIANAEKIIGDAKDLKDLLREIFPRIRWDQYGIEAVQ